MRDDDIYNLSLEDLKRLNHLITLRIKQLESEQTGINKGKTLYLVEESGYWYIVTPPLATGTRKKVKLCKRLSHVEILNQSIVKAPDIEDPLYKKWQRYMDHANATRTIELGLTVEGERELRRLEKQGVKIIC